MFTRFQTKVVFASETTPIPMYNLKSFNFTCQTDLNALNLWGMLAETKVNLLFCNYTKFDISTTVKKYGSNSFILPPTNRRVVQPGTRRDRPTTAVIQLLFKLEAEICAFMHEYNASSLCMKIFIYVGLQAYNMNDVEMIQRLFMIRLTSSTPDQPWTNANSA